MRWLLLVVLLPIVKIVYCRNMDGPSEMLVLNGPYRQQMTSPIIEKQAENDKKWCVSQPIITRNHP